MVTSRSRLRSVIVAPSNNGLPSAKYVNSSSTRTVRSNSSDEATTNLYGSATLVSSDRITMEPSRVPRASSANAITDNTSRALSPGASRSRSASAPCCCFVANDTTESRGSFFGNSTRTLLAGRNPSFVTFT
ncbi:hypothetical protein NP493_1g11014 [Ridgeia piscesae]|uniref:Uncharacterized protein n=1 Tax=Ridgeia piscesae TaxID=27915 RepID=A0AAD9PGM6_RIDPI|nr:hypothetical protein NP493_1g11014 [Ridgeia piscesae]